MLWPYELPGERAQRHRAAQLIADERTVGDTAATFFTALHPKAPWAVTDCLPLAGQPGDASLNSRQVRLMVSGVAVDDWRWGAPSEADAGSPAETEFKQIWSDWIWA